MGEYARRRVVFALALGLAACTGRRVAAPPDPARASAHQAACPTCQDGFGKNCYFDSTLHKASELKVDIHMPRETELVCFALESFSTCHTCYHDYFLRRGEDLVPVTGAEFERAIAEKNKSCNNCLQFVQSGPG